MKRGGADPGIVAHKMAGLVGQRPAQTKLEVRRALLKGGPSNRGIPPLTISGFAHADCLTKSRAAVAFSSTLAAQAIMRSPLSYDDAPDRPAARQAGLPFPAIHAVRELEPSPAAFGIHVI